MKKFTSIIILALTFMITRGLAQPIITGLNGAPLGTKSMGYNIPGTIIPGAAGANQTWDYSGIPHDTSTFYFMTVDYAGLPQAIKDSFPTANTATEYHLNGNLAATLLYKLTASEFLYLGLNNTVFATPDTQLVFPHSYQETKAGFTYDAYGTLKTPFGTYNNVVRLKETDGSNYKYDYWQFSPVYTILMEYLVDTATQAVSGKYFFNTNAATSVAEKDVQSRFVLYPNPVADELFLLTQLRGTFKANIYDITGRVVAQNIIELQSNVPGRIDVSCLNEGTYFLDISDNEKSYQQKFILQ